MHEIVHLIRFDPGIAARVLQVGNSAYFNQGSHCATVEDAVHRVGYDQIYELVASPASLVTPYLPPWGHKPNPLPDKVTINRRTWQVTGNRQLTATVDNNVGLIRIEPGRNGRYRFTLQLWRVRPLIGVAGRVFGKKAAKGAQPIHDPIEIELR